MEETKQPLDWDTVYWEHMSRVFNYFRYRVGDDAAAEDLTAITFVKAWKARGDYDPRRGAVSTWLLTIARNTAIDYFRRAREHVPLDMLETAQVSAADSLQGGAIMRPVEEVQQQSDEFFRLADLLTQLSPRERELIALKFGADMTNRAIATLTGISESNVGTILFRTMKWLRSTWEVTNND